MTRKPIDPDALAIELMATEGDADDAAGLDGLIFLLECELADRAAAQQVRA